MEKKPDEIQTLRKPARAAKGKPRRLAKGKRGKSRSRGTGYQECRPWSSDDRRPTGIDFLKKLRPGGPWVLTAIVPDGATETITARDAEAVRAFVRKHDGKRNIYYSVNPTRRAMTSKAAKNDIAAIEYLPPISIRRTTKRPKRRRHATSRRSRTSQAGTTAIIDSGNGLQILLKLAEPIELPEPVIKTEGKKVFPAETAALIDDVESRTKALMETLGSVAGTQNIDSICACRARSNLPNAKKHARAASHARPS